MTLAGHDSGALAELKDLSDPERVVCRAFVTGAAVSFADTGAELRAEVLRALLLGALERVPGHLPGLRVTGARIVGSLALAYAEIDCPIRLSNCVFDAQIDLYGARTRQFNLSGSHLFGLEASTATIDGNLNLAGSRSLKTIRLVGAKVGGALVLSGARLSASVALDGSRLSIGDDFIGHDGFLCEGEMRLRNASVGGAVRLEGAQLRNPKGTALRAVEMSVGAIMNCCEGFTAEGKVQLSWAKVGSRLCFDKAFLTNPDGDALVCRYASAPEFLLLPSEPILGVVDLRHGKFSILRDDPTKLSGELRIDGLVYEAMPTIDSVPMSERIAALGRSRQAFYPQPYEQLAALCRRLGRDDDARTVLLAKQRHEHRFLSLPAKLWGNLQNVTVGYGYRPARALAWLIFLVVVGAVVFSFYPPSPTEEGNPTELVPAVYALDIVLPVIDLHQESAFAPSGWTTWLTYPLILAGLTLATTIAAGVTRALKRT